MIVLDTNEWIEHKIQLICGHIYLLRYFFSRVSNFLKWEQFTNGSELTFSISMKIILFLWHQKNSTPNPTRTEEEAANAFHVKALHYI